MGPGIARHGSVCRVRKSYQRVRRGGVLSLGPVSGYLLSPVPFSGLWTPCGLGHLLYSKVCIDVLYCFSVLFLSFSLLYLSFSFSSLLRVAVPGNYFWQSDRLG